MDLRKIWVISAIFCLMAAPIGALTLEKGLKKTNQQLDEMVSAYEKAVENGEIVNQEKYNQSLDHFDQALNTFYNISSKIKEVAPAEYKEGQIAIRTAGHYLEVKEPALRIKILARVFKGEADEIIYMAEHGGEEPPEEKAERVGDINLDAAETAINETRELLEVAVSNYKEAVDQREIVDEAKYQKALSKISEAIKKFEDNQQFIKATEKAEAEYDEAISVLYTGEYYMQSKEPVEELEYVEELFSEEETVEILHSFRKSAKLSEEDEKGTGGTVPLTWLLAIIVVFALVVLYMRKEKIL